MESTPTQSSDNNINNNNINNLSELNNGSGSGSGSIGGGGGGVCNGGGKIRTATGTLPKISTNATILLGIPPKTATLQAIKRQRHTPTAAAAATTSTVAATTTTTTVESITPLQKHYTFPFNSSSPLHIVTSTQQQQQQQQQHHQQQHHQQQQRKNTEIVAPIRREFKELNDYLLSAVTTEQRDIDSGGSGGGIQQQSYSKHKLQNNQSYSNSNINNNSNINDFNKPTAHYLCDTNAISANAVGGTFDIDNSHENQRFCYPVRPIPRRNLQTNQQLQQQQQQQYHHQQQQQNLLQPLQTVGVVIPTTPNPAINNHQQQQQQEDTSTHRAQQQQQTNSNLYDLAANSNLTDLTLSQRLQLLQQFLHLTNKTNGDTATATPATTTTTPLNVNNKRQQRQATSARMVHEINATQPETVVNSTSLEDVASESSGRAQSIQSLHSALDTPTPDTTPSYDELQQSLEASNRNIESLQAQQQQLLWLQNAAKQHLTEMENLRQHAGNLSFNTTASHNGTNGTTTNGSAGDDTPVYESIDQVHTDMAALAGRMKNLTAFIHNQNELSNLLGDDGPEILAEQEALQRKLESLRVQRDEMRNLVDELQDINRSAEKSAKEARNQRERSADDVTPTREPAPVPAPATVNAGERVVPVEFSRVVPIELLQTPGVGGHIEDEAVDPETAELIRQKAADVEAMKAQLKRLKDMMETVNLIETHTARDPKEIGRTPAAPATRSRDHTPCAAANASTIDVEDGGDENQAFLARKVRMLNEVTSDLRSQAESLQAERDRIKALKEEIIRRKAQAAAAAQLGEDALKRHSLTPTPRRRQLSEQEEDEDDNEVLPDTAQLKAEYEAKKQEFARLCQSMPSTETPQATVNRTVSEADDETDERNYAVPTGRKHLSSAQRARGGSKNVPDVAASSTPIPTTEAGHDGGTSLEANSMQSGSSRSFSIPPPMPAMGSAFNWHGQMPHSTGINGLHASLCYCPPAAEPSPLGITSTPFTPPLHVSAGANNAPAATSCTTHAATAVTGTNSSTASTSAAVVAPPHADAMMLQQYSQTQQVLINSICQCNQMLWHQQHEIDTLKHTIHLLQERLLSYNIPTADLSFNLRAESMPPPPPLPLSAGIGPFTLTSNSRAQSEQPLAFMPVNALNTRCNYASNYQQMQQQHIFQQRHQQQHQQHHGIAGGYNYSSDTQQQQQQQQNVSSTNTNMYATLNNAVPQANVNAAAPVPPPPATAAQFNNEAPQSPMSVPGPIFMHHHNNAIHQNNANLRTQNHYANNLQHQAAQNATNIGTLNNQVPPGNRANNYWDNFRSYSRQNLLSTNSSNKSNEEQQHQLQQQQQQQQQSQPDDYHVAPTITIPTTAATNQTPPQQQQQQQQQQRNLYHHHRSMKMLGHCNNLNLESNVCNNVAGGNRATSGINNIMRPNQIPPQTPQHTQLYRQQNMQHAACNNLCHNQTTTATTTWHDQQQQQQQQHAAHDNNELFDLQRQTTPQYNILDNVLMDATYEHTPTAATSNATSNLRNNMNVNFGNSPHYQRNKLPTKQIYHSEFALRQQQQQQQQQQPPPPQPHMLAYVMDKLSGGVGVGGVGAGARAARYHQRNMIGTLAPRGTRYGGSNSGRSLSLAQAAAATRHERKRDYLMRTAALLGNAVDAVDGSDVEDNGVNMTASSAAAGAATSTFNYDYNMPIAVAHAYDEADDNDNANDDDDGDVDVDGDDDELENAALNNNDDDDAENDDDDDDDDGDTTSEEIKRNLLVNALKNDKFTTKFYESIKEDLFRRLESMLLESDCAKQQTYQQKQQQPFYNNNNNTNNVDVAANVSAGVGAASGGARTRDPMRKLYWNARQAYDNQTPTLPPPLPASRRLIAHEQQQQQQFPTFLLKEEPEEYNNAMDGDDTESNKAEHESEKPEDETNIYNGCDGSGDGQMDAVIDDVALPASGEQANWRKNVSESVKKLSQVKSSKEGAAVGSVANSKKRKSQRATGREQSEASQCAPDSNKNVQLNTQTATTANTLAHNDTTTNIPDYNLIRYIMRRIRNQTHINTEINDAMLVEIAKLTAAAAENSTTTTTAAAAGATSITISPKKIYAKIKKLCLPRQRDEFLCWYGGYLETLLRCESEMPMEMTLAANTTTTNAMAMCTNLGTPTNAMNLQIIDADLAEADQICSPNTTCSNNSNHHYALNDNANNPNASNKQTDDENDVFVAVTANTTAAATTTTTASIENVLSDALQMAEELENNENPNEEYADVQIMKAKNRAEGNNVQENGQLVAEQSVQKVAQENDNDDGEVNEKEQEEDALLVMRSQAA